MEISSNAFWRVFWKFSVPLSPIRKVVVGSCYPFVRLASALLVGEFWCLIIEVENAFTDIYLGVKTHKLVDGLTQFSSKMGFCHTSTIINQSHSAGTN